MSPPMLVAYDDDGNVIATLHYRVAKDSHGNVVGLVDFAAHEEMGGENLDIWRVEQVAETAGGEVRKPARGSKVWPYRMGDEIHEYRVELEGQAGRKKIGALIRRETAERLDRTPPPAPEPPLEPPLPPKLPITRLDKFGASTRGGEPWVPTPPSEKRSGRL